MDVCYICGPVASFEKGISFHKFPECSTTEDAWVLEKWIKYVEMNGVSCKWISESSKLCSSHFISEDFIDTVYTQCSSAYANSMRYLKDQAYPSVMLEVVEVVLPHNIDDYDDNLFMEKDNNIVSRKNKGTDEYGYILRKEEQNYTVLKEEKDFVKEEPEEVDNAFIKEEEKMCEQIKEELEEELDLINIKYGNLIIKEEVTVAQAKKEYNAFIEEVDIMEGQIKKEVDENGYIKTNVIFSQVKKESEEENSVFIKDEPKNVNRIMEQDNTVLEEEKNSVKEKPEELSDSFIKEEEGLCAQTKEVFDLKDIKVGNLIIKEGEEIVAQFKKEYNAFIKENDIMEDQIKEKPKEDSYVVIKGNVIFGQVKKESEEEISAFIKEGKKNVDWIKEQDNTVLKEEEDSVKEKSEEVGITFIKEEYICAQKYSS